jgi:hypothetical protein
VRRADDDDEVNTVEDVLVGIGDGDHLHVGRQNPSAIAVAIWCVLPNIDS